MKVEFKWIKTNDDYSPICKSDAVYKDEFSLLDCILMDDGGLGYLSSVAWISEALKNIESIKNKQIDKYDWLREAWGAELTNKGAKVYSLLDEGHFQVFDLKTFEMVLRTWQEFIQKNNVDRVEYEF